MRSILFVFALFLASAAYSQPTTAFSSDAGKFMKELDEFMNANKVPDCKEAYDELAGLVKSGKVTPGMLDKIISTSNLMKEKTMGPSPYFVRYLKSVAAFTGTDKGEGPFAEWTATANELLRATKRGEYKDWNSLIEFTSNYYGKNALNVSASKSWHVDSKDGKLKFSEGKISFSVPATRFFGATNGDTTQIFNTSGIYYPTENKWQGKGGTVNWVRAGLDKGKVFASFTGSYTVNLANFAYTIDSVTFTHKEFFERTLSGRVIDKIIIDNDTIKSQFPRFESYETNITIKDVAPGITYFGGFNLWGSKVVGYSTDEQKAGFDFYSRDGKTKVLRALSNNILIMKNKMVGAEKAEISLYFGKDSIYHPSINLDYKVEKREIRLIRGENAIGRSRFVDSYHQFEFETDAIVWNIDSPKLALKILSGVGNNAANFESNDYFNKDRIRQIQGVASYEPLSILRILVNELGTNEITAEAIAKKINAKMTEAQVKSLLYILVENGFIAYNEATGMVTVRDKTNKYVMANAKKVDYDNIRLRSFAKDGTDYIDLKNSNLDLKGVVEIPISDTANVKFFPRSKAVSLQKNRNMNFDGTIIGGRLDLVGKDYKFAYDSFLVNLTKVDSMIIYIPDGDKLDEDGKPALKPLRSKLENLNGVLNIDAPINKSGRSRLAQFPKIKTAKPSQVFYEDSTSNKGAYSKKDFYYQVEPFEIDSLNNLEPSVIDFKGKLVSGGIFPDITEGLKLQEDLSLGFKTGTPKEGLALFKDKGNYKGTIDLQYEGLKGDGVITYSTSAFKSSDIRFYPDSVLATADSFTIKETATGVMTPDVRSINSDVFWKSKVDSMFIKMKDSPFAMYNGQTQLNGNLLLTNKGLFGNGTLDWSDANLTSKMFSFKTQNLSADTADLKIKTPDGNETAFRSANVTAKVDFKKREGNFSNNLKGVPTEFAYNQYNTLIPDFRWDIDKHILEFKSPAGSKGEYFASLNPASKGLKFLAKRATFDLLSSILKVEEIPEIIVADSRILPDSGTVTIEGQAKMRTLQNATIISDTLNGTHKITKATLDIISKVELKGSGEYKYQTINTPEQTIVFNEISVLRSKISDKKKDKDNDEYHLSSKGAIEDGQQFTLYPNVTFTGDASLFSQQKGLTFKGVAKIKYKNNLVEPAEFSFEDTVNPKDFFVKYKADVKNKEGIPVAAAISVAKGADPIHPYTNLLSVKENITDPALINAVGVVAYNSKTRVWSFGDEKKIKEGALKGTILKMNDSTGSVTGEGDLPLALDFGLIGMKAVGTVENDIDKNDYKMNMTIGFDIQTNKDIQEKLSKVLFDDNIDLNDVAYDNDRFKRQLYQLSDEKKDEAMLKEYEKTTMFKRPKDYNYNLVFTNVNFVFDKDDATLRSTGKLGLSFAGEKGVHKTVNGWIEMGYRPGADYLNIYIRTGTAEWVFIEYRPGVLGVLSSYDEFTNLIAPLMTSGKNVVKGDNGKFYRYVIGNSSNRAEFVDRMKEKNGITSPDEEKPKPKPAKIDSTPVNKDAPRTLPADGSEQKTPQAVPLENGVPAIDTTTPAPVAPVDGAGTGEEKKEEGKKAKKTKEPKVEAPKEETPANLPPAMQEFYKKDKGKKKKGDGEGEQ